MEYLKKINDYKGDYSCGEHFRGFRYGKIEGWGKRGLYRVIMSMIPQWFDNNPYVILRKWGSVETL